MKLKCFLVRDVLLHHGSQSVRVTEDIEAEVEFPDGTDVTRGVGKDMTKGEWRVVKVGGNTQP